MTLSLIAGMRSRIGRDGQPRDNSSTDTGTLPQSTVRLFGRYGCIMPRTSLLCLPTCSYQILHIVFCLLSNSDFKSNYPHSWLLSPPTARKNPLSTGARRVSPAVKSNSYFSKVKLNSCGLQLSPSSYLLNRLLRVLSPFLIWLSEIGLRSLASLSRPIREMRDAHSASTPPASPPLFGPSRTTLTFPKLGIIAFSAVPADGVEERD